MSRVIDQIILNCRLNTKFFYLYNLCYFSHKEIQIAAIPLADFGSIIITRYSLRDFYRSLKKPTADRESNICPKEKIYHL